MIFIQKLAWHLNQGKMETQSRQVKEAGQTTVGWWTGSNGG